MNAMKRLLTYWMVITFIVLLSACVSRVSERSQAVEETSRIDNLSRVSVVAVGDNLIHNTIYEAAYHNGTYDFRPFYQAIKPFISAHDLAFINQETMLGGVELGLSSYPSFNSPVEVGEALIDAGFNLFSIANNHTLDRGEQAIINTVEFFWRKPCVYSGAEISPNISHLKIFTKNGITFGFIAYTMLTNGQSHPEGKTYLANVYSREQAMNDLQEAREKVDVLLVSMHWGTEYESYPDDVQKEEAHFLARLGVDVIIGHHPHVIQPIEWIETDGHETLVIYSLGNFLSDQKGIDRKIGMAVSFDLIKANGKKIMIDQVVATLLYHNRTENGLYRVIPYAEVTPEDVPDHEAHQMAKAMIIQAYDERIIVR